MGTLERQAATTPSQCYLEEQILHPVCSKPLLTRLGETLLLFRPGYWWIFHKSSTPNAGFFVTFHIPSNKFSLYMNCAVMWCHPPCPLFRPSGPCSSFPRGSSLTKYPHFFFFLFIYGHASPKGNLRQVFLANFPLFLPRGAPVLDQRQPRSNVKRNPCHVLHQ